MAHKTLIGGTAYEVSGGKTLVGGTTYAIKNGKTLVGGTVHGIEFLPRITISGGFGGSKGLAYCIVDGVTYDAGEIGAMLGIEIRVPIGTKITCYVRAAALSSANATIKVNDTVVVETQSVVAQSYEYIVIGDTIISMGNTMIGNIGITEL